ncbi:hypothetical protein M6B38_311260 [Iris pallida]|uniref:Uncharacterized protein n=1 Tax=Iris pallida TaxID=29817 RepID=A0AAX6HHF6_IRIPA|nr:hypothetical protein M6B38_311260 [Iris pallida]
MMAAFVNLEDSPMFRKQVLLIHLAIDLNFFPHIKWFLLALIVGYFGISLRFVRSLTVRYFPRPFSTTHTCPTRNFLAIQVVGSESKLGRVVVLNLGYG